MMLLGYLVWFLVWLLVAGGLLLLGRWAIRHDRANVPDRPIRYSTFLGSMLLRSVVSAVLVFGGLHVLPLIVSPWFAGLCVPGFVISPLVGLVHGLSVVVMTTLISVAPRARQSV